MLWPTLNPDGQDMVVSWYRKNLGTHFEVSPMPWLFQDYVGHDNNRDGYMLNMKESQVVAQTEIAWAPAIFYCQHQTAPFPARIWIPPFSDPISSNISPYVRSWFNVIGTNMSAYLDEHQMPGAISESQFDNWYPGFVDYAGSFRNEISFFTETALYRYATPRFYTVDEFPKDMQDLKALTMYTTPWQGGWWHLKDAVDYMVAGSMSVLDTAARYREQLLFNRYQAARDNIKRFEDSPPFAYVIPSVQSDAPEAELLVPHHAGERHRDSRIADRFPRERSRLSGGLVGHPHEPTVFVHGQRTIRGAALSRGVVHRKREAARFAL
jgi:hypothetical protein